MSSHFSQGVSHLQNNMQNIFGGLAKRRAVRSSVDANDRQDLMEEDDDDGDDDDSLDKEKTKSRRPKVTAFTQQRLKAVHPILTAQIIVPLLLVIAVIFIPIGAAMIHASNKVQDFTIDYAHCAELASRDHWSTIPDEYYTHNFANKDNVRVPPPQWKLSTNESSVWDDYPEERDICQVQFTIPNDIQGPIYMFYRLTKFHANHRQFAKSFSEDQINGKVASVSTIKDTVGQNCQPLSVNDDGKIIYPCGLIANSMFNDTFTDTLLSVNSTSTGAGEDYVMSKSGISWSTNPNRFKKTKYNPDDVVPPPNWIKMFPQGYTEDNMPDISTWEEFQNWMSPAVLSDFANLVQRNDTHTLLSGVYETSIGLHFPTTEYSGAKQLFVSTTSRVGGRNSFLGVAWTAAGGVCLVLAVVLAAAAGIKHRTRGDTALLSWNSK